MIAVVKLSAQSQVKLRYQAEVIERQPHGMIVASTWTDPPRDLGCVRFEQGDRFTEYYYADRWFNIQEVVNSAGVRKGWYCDITEPAVIAQEQISLVDLELDVWVNVQGQPMLLDEDEFETCPLSEAQRKAAREGVQALLTMLETRSGPFAVLYPAGKLSQRRGSSSLRMGERGEFTSIAEKERDDIVLLNDDF